jgi:hypothetical protein
MPDTDLPAVLIVTDDVARATALHEAIEPHVALTAPSADEARTVLARQEVALVLADLKPAGLQLLEQCAKEHPAVLRLLLAEHADLPELVQARANGLLRRVVSKTARPRRVRKVVADELGAAVEISRTKEAPQQGQARELVRWTVERIARVPGLVIRELPADPSTLQMQLVVPKGERFDKLRAELPLAWSAPAADNPVLKHLPDLDAGAQVFVAPSGGAWLYLALLPWRREPRITLALGIVSAKPVPRTLLELAHAIALEEVEDLPLPQVPAPEESTGAGQPVFEYDWIVTPSYVGRDRRKESTAFLDKFAVIGRRERVSSKIQSRANVFVDRVTPRFKRYAIAYVLLSLVDTAFTLQLVRGGIVRELNPVLRPLVLGSPALFLAAKNALALTGLFLLARFQLFPLGLWLMRAVLALYLLLDVYWIWLLVA